MPDTNATPPTVALPTHVELDRRKLLLTLGSFAAGTAAIAGPGEQRAFAQSAQPASRNPMTDNTKIIDFHCHHIPARFELTAARYAPASQRARWEPLARTLSDENLLLKDVRDGALGARVVSLLIQLIADAEGRVPHETTVAMNDALAELVGRHPGRIHGLASVDAYDGDKSAREAERAIRELGLHGLLLECARGDLLLDAPQARPTLEVAAKLGVPVFAHPIAPQPLTKQMVPYGLIGTLFARGAVNSAALIALVEGGVFSQLPNLRIVFTAQAIGGLAMAAGLSSQSRLPSGTIEVMRKNVFIDTTLFHPALIRALVDLLGPDNVLAGSDWPIAGDRPVRDILLGTMQSAGLSNAEQTAIAGSNCSRLLGLG
jgi:predicted TIM-barrel fold metal-dependent hydrolase